MAKIKNTGIFDSPTPDNEADLSRLYDLGGVPLFASLIPRYEAHALAVLARHGIVSDGINLRPGSAIWREDGSFSLVGVKVESPPEVLDARSMLFAIEVFRCQRTRVSGFLQRWPRQKKKRTQLILRADVEHSIGILCGHAAKIGELATKLAVRPFEQAVLFAEGTRRNQKARGPLSVEGRARNSEIVDRARKKLIADFVAKNRNARSGRDLARKLEDAMKKDPGFQDVLKATGRKRPKHHTIRRNLRKWGFVLPPKK